MKKGYNRYEVDDAFRKTEEKIDDLSKKLEAYRIQNEEYEKRLKRFKFQYEEISKSIDMKEQAAKDITRMALVEANDIVSNANTNADLIVKEALVSARSILLNISKLGVEASEIKLNLHKQMEILEEAIQGFDVPPIPSEELMKKYDE